MKAVGPDYYDDVFKQNAASPTKLAQNVFRCGIVARHLVGSVLDLGCGLGLVADMVGGEYVGVDFSPYAVGWARANAQNPQAHFMIRDLRAMPDIGRFDTVLLGEILEHVDDPAGLARAALERAGKRVVVTVPVEMGGPAHVKPNWSRKDLEALFGPLASFEIVSNENPRMAETIIAVVEMT